MKNKITFFLLLFITCFSCIFAKETLNINSKTAVAMDADSSIILHDKNMNQKIYPASTTKILTAILAIENLDLNKSVVVSETAIQIPWDSSSVYLKKGEVITVNDLLYCLMLNSGNDAANVLAEAVSGDIASFVKLMNDKLKEIGCTNTNFTNAHGYSDDNHYTTALDMAKILSYCIKNEEFVKIMSTKSYIVKATNKTNENRYLYNTNRLILTKEDSVYARFYEYCIGGKTGYTDEAGRTLVTFGRKDNKTVIVCIFGASTNGSQDVRYTDAINLFEYSFNNFSKKVIAEASNYTFNYINTNSKLNYTLGLKENFEIMYSNNETPDFSYTINIDDNNLKDLDEQNFQEVLAGYITFNFNDSNGISYSSNQPLYLKNITKHRLTTNYSYILIIVLVFICLAALFSIIINNKKTHLTFADRKSKSRKSRRS